MKIHRKRWALSQVELGHLLGTSKSTVSRLEQGDLAPPVRTMLALEVVFGLPARALLPRFYAEIEERVMRQAAGFSVEIEAARDPERAIKRELLADMMSRAGNAASA
jgi:transcriptional regulator with XRE-family HTH domain